MAEWMICPVCGRLFESIYYQCLINGNPACSQCVRKETEEDDERKEQTK